MKAILFASFMLAATLFPGALAISSGPGGAAPAAGSCSTTQLFGSGGAFTVCVSRTTLRVNQQATIDMAMTNNSPGNLFYYSALLSITNGGSPVYSSSQSCPTQYGCVVGPGQTYTVTFVWTATHPKGLDTVQGTLNWDYGCRPGCQVLSPPPATTAVMVTIK